MHRSSESIGTIAAALAKAQAELTNPEKSLVATIRSPSPVRETAPSATPRCRAVLTLSARALAGMRSRQSRPPQSTKMPAFFASQLCLLIRRANGFLRNGPCVRSPISPQRNAWEQRLLMPDAMRCSRSSELLGKMILTRRTSMQRPKPEAWSRPDPIIATNQPAMQELRHGLATAQSSVSVQEHPFSRRINRQWFGGVCSLNWSPSTQPMRRLPGRVGIFPPRTRLQRGMPELSKRNFKR